MSKRNDMSVPSRIRAMSEKNRVWLESYLDSLKEINLSEKSIYQYSMLLIRLIEFNQSLDMDKITINDISDYLGSNKLSDNRLNFSLTVIKNFLEFISKKTPISLDLEGFSELRITRKEVEARKTMPLSVTEIVKIRNVLKDDLTRLFTFEIVYQHGLKLDELELISPDKYNSTNRTLQLTKTKAIIFSKRLTDIISRSNKVLNKRTRYHLQDIISEIGQRISRNLVWRDIIETREKFFFTCSLCSSKFENTPENWAMIQHSGSDDTLWIVCKDCALKEAINE